MEQTPKDNVHIDSDGKIQSGGIFHSSHEYFFKRVLQQAALTILQIAQEMKLNEAIHEQIFKLMKMGLSRETDILVDRHLDQIVLCAVYLVCKINASTKTMKFNQILEVYDKVANPASCKANEVYMKVFVEGNTYVDIIKFYNLVYVPKMKYCV